MGGATLGLVTFTTCRLGAAEGALGFAFSGEALGAGRLTALALAAFLTPAFEVFFAARLATCFEDRFFSALATKTRYFFFAVFFAAFFGAFFAVFFAALRFFVAMVMYLPIRVNLLLFKNR